FQAEDGIRDRTVTGVQTCALPILGSAFAQTSGSAQPSGSGGAGTSATGGRSAPAAQPGEGTRKSESTKDDKVSKADRKFIEKAEIGRASCRERVWMEVGAQGQERE